VVGTLKLGKFRSVLGFGRWIELVGSIGEIGDVETSTRMMVGVAVFVDELLILHSGNGIRRSEIIDS